MFYKLKVTRKSIKIVDTVEEVPENDNGFIYATEDEIKLLNPEAVDHYAKGIELDLF